MTTPVPSGSPDPDPSLDDERPPTTRREAREKAQREAAQEAARDTGDVPTDRSEFEQSFWSSLDGPRPAPGDGPVSTDTRANVWASLEYPTDGKQSRRSGRGGASGSEPPRRKRRRWLVVTIVTVVIVALLGGAGAYVWSAFQPEVRKLLALNEPNDYTGTGTTPVNITIKDGDSGGDVATTLQKAGVVKTYDAFYSLLLSTKPDPVFQPGVYKLKKQMSAKSALAALQDPKNKLERTVTIPEGDTEASILPALAKTTGVSLADLQAAAAKPTDFGLPPQAKNLDGFLFPATYTFDPDVDAKTVIKTLVDRAFQAFDEDGVPAADRWNTVILASVVQKEAGSVADMGKVARVFQNRLDQGMRLQSDATVAYGAGVKTVFTTDAERDDASNLYNTYAHDGLPIGPISNPGDDAIKAALNPTPGPWLYFVTVDLKDGTTVFSQTAAEHDAAVQQLQDWCNASAANDAYCQ